MTRPRPSRRTVLKIGGLATVTAAMTVTAGVVAFRQAAAGTSGEPGAPSDPPSDPPSGSPSPEPSASTPPEPGPQPVLVGTYTGSGGPGLGVGRIDPATGAPVVDAWTTAVPEPSWIARGPGGATVYAVGEQTAGTVSALRLSPDGPPALLGTVPTGSGPAHVAVHPGGGFLFTSLYGGGATVTHPIAADGAVGAATDTRPQRVGGRASNAHQVVVDPTGGWVLSVDLGVDTVFSYTLDAAAGTLTEAHRLGLPRGTGPRHLAFHPGGAFAYVLAEYASTVTVCAWADGVLTPGQVVAAAPGTGVDNHPAEILVSADGRFVYASNRGTNTIGVFAVSEDGAHLERVAAPSCGGDWPRHLSLDATGGWLYAANQRSGTVVWFPVDAATGIPGEAAGTLPVPAVAFFG